MYVTYNEQTGEEYDHLDIFFTKSTDGGENWTAAENISNNQDYNARFSTKVMGNIYKNDAYLASVPSLQTSYTYEGIGMGTHSFYVTSVYEQWESNPSNTVEIVVTSNENQEMLDVTVGPVPASEVLNIAFNDSKVSGVRLLDISGRVIIEKQVDFSARGLELNLPEHLNGVYIIDIEGDKDSLRRKVIIE